MCQKWRRRSILVGQRHPFNQQLCSSSLLYYIMQNQPLERRDGNEGAPNCNIASWHVLGPRSEAKQTHTRSHWARNKERVSAREARLRRELPCLSGHFHTQKGFGTRTVFTTPIINISLSCFIVSRCCCDGQVC